MSYYTRSKDKRLQTLKGGWEDVPRDEQGRWTSGGVARSVAEAVGGSAGRHEGMARVSVPVKGVEPNIWRGGNTPGRDAYFRNNKRIAAVTDKVRTALRSQGWVSVNHTKTTFAKDTFEADMHTVDDKVVLDIYQPSYLKK